MKLRNKKTGEIVSLSLYGISLNIRSSEQPTYHSIGELNEDWEDYKPTEPLIKEEKIRKLVRDWAKFNEIEKALIEKEAFNDAWYQILGKDGAMCYWRIQIHASYSETVCEEYKGNWVSITELYGSEEIEILEPTYTTIEEKETLKEKQ